MAYATTEAANLGTDQIEVLASLLDAILALSGNSGDIGEDDTANKPQEEQK